jgi:hypothetical protein
MKVFLFECLVYRSISDSPLIKHIQMLSKSQLKTFATSKPIEIYALEIGNLEELDLCVEYSSHLKDKRFHFGNLKKLILRGELNTLTFKQMIEDGLINTLQEIDIINLELRDPDEIYVQIFEAAKVSETLTTLRIPCLYTSDIYVQTLLEYLSCNDGNLEMLLTLMLDPFLTSWV